MGASTTVEIASNTTKDRGQESEGWMKSLPFLHQHANLLPEPPIGQTYLEGRGEEILSLNIQNTVEAKYVPPNWANKS